MRKASPPQSPSQKTWKMECRKFISLVEEGICDTWGVGWLWKFSKKEWRGLKEGRVFLVVIAVACLLVGVWLDRKLFQPSPTVPGNVAVQDGAVRQPSPWISVGMVVDAGNTESQTGEPTDTIKVKFPYTNHGSEVATNLSFDFELPGGVRTSFDTHAAVAPNEGKIAWLTIPKEQALAVYHAIYTDGSLTRVTVHFDDLAGHHFEILSKIVWNKEAGNFSSPEVELKGHYLDLKRP